MGFEHTDTGVCGQRSTSYTTSDYNTTDYTYNNNNIILAQTPDIE